MRLHQGLCQKVPYKTVASIRPVWLVDVIDACLVPAPKDCSYVTLSYVWGDRKTLKTNSSNLTQLQEIGSLEKHQWKTQLPRTIRDAIGVVKILAEKYLWVDNLCIVQDDEVHKHTEMAKMAAIYANASVTILALQGRHADHGLPGFRDFSEPSTMRQSFHVLDEGVTIIRNFVSSHLEVGSEDPVARSRGWILQEEMFSRKKLVFDGDSIRWECPAATWREHVEMSHRSKSYRHDNSIWQPMLESSIPDLDRLGSILRQFNCRYFTYPEDALNAFAGVSFAISPALGGAFVSGLPTAFFDIALLWQPDNKITRRVSASPTNAQYLPSWSWAGWHGNIMFDTASAFDFVRKSPDPVLHSRERRITRILSWSYHESTNSPGTRIFPSILSSKDAWLADRNDCVQGWIQHDTSGKSEAQYAPPDPRLSPTRYYSHPSHPGYEFWYPVPLRRPEDAILSVQAPFISTKTRSAWFFPAEEVVKKNGYTSLVSLRDERGRWVGVLTPHDDLDESGKMLQTPNGAIEMVEIATGLCTDAVSPWPGIEEIRHPERPRSGRWYEYFWVMWIGREESIAHRKGLGRVIKHVWEAQRGHVIDLMLG